MMENLIGYLCQLQEKLQVYEMAMMRVNEDRQKIALANCIGQEADTLQKVISELVQKYNEEKEKRKLAEIQEKQEVHACVDCAVEASSEISV